MQWKAETRTKNSKPNHLKYPRVIFF